MAISTKLMNPAEKLHIALMKEIVRAVSDTPLILKGGTALLLAYNLDRFSEDLDFDSPKAMRLENKIQTAAIKHVQFKTIDLIKDTETVSRYRLVYECPYGERRLKIETSLREYHPESIQIIDGMKTYDLPVLVSQKLNALENRTRARDLYDIAFLAKTHPSSFTPMQLDRLMNILADLNALEKRFSPAFENDSILFDQDVTKITLSLHEAVKHIQR